jgi:hypothetical protein
MESRPVRATTIVSADLTLQDVLSAGGALNQEQFAVIANAAQREAAATSGDAIEKAREFDATLLKYCNSFGDDIARRNVLVFGAKAEFPFTVYWEASASRLHYFRVGDDKNHYAADVFP